MTTIQYKELTSCPLCGAKQLITQYRMELPVVRCMICGLVFVQKQPEIQPSAFYQEFYYEGNSPYKNNLDNENVLAPERIPRRLDSCRGVTELVGHHISKPGKWLDIGCGPGFLLFEASQAGWQPTGIEPSPFASQYARENFGLTDVRTADIESTDFPPFYFDVISMQHVIEHFADPVNTMKKIGGWLKPGGLLYLETPDIDSPIAREKGIHWEHLKLPEHLFYFSQATLRLLLQKLACEFLVVHHPVKSTGLMNKVCGGEKQAARFYDRFHDNPIFRKGVKAVRFMNEMYRSRVKGESDIIHILARKSEQAN